MDDLEINPLNCRSGV